MKTQSKTNQRVKKTAVKAVKAVHSPTVSTSTTQTGETVQTVPIEQVALVDICPNPVNPRRFFDEDSLAELAQKEKRSWKLRDFL